MFLGTRPERARRLALAICFTAAIVTTAAATNQSPDWLSVDGVEYPLHTPWPNHSLPLDHLPEVVDALVPLGGMTTGCWRGYVARWELVDGGLFLRDLDREEVIINPPGERVDRPPWQSFFVDWTEDGEVRASWYSGLLQVSSQGPGPQFPRQVPLTTFEIREGWLISRQTEKILRIEGDAHSLWAKLHHEAWMRLAAADTAGARRAFAKAADEIRRFDESLHVAGFRHPLVLAELAFLARAQGELAAAGSLRRHALRVFSEVDTDQLEHHDIDATRSALATSFALLSGPAASELPELGVVHAIQACVLAVDGNYEMAFEHVEAIRMRDLQLDARFIIHRLSGFFR